MTAHVPSPLSDPHNLQAFETCVVAALRITAAVEFAPVLSDARPTVEMLLAYAGELDRHAHDIALLTGEIGVDPQALGADWYARLVNGRDEPIAAAYQTLHAAAFLGLEGGLTTAQMLAATACALRDLARREGRLSH